MLIVLTKSQSLLFDAPVQVAGSVRADGTLVAPHVRIQKIAAKRVAAPRGTRVDGLPPPQSPRVTKLDAWVARHGGEAAVARIMAWLTHGQRQQLIAEMERLSGLSAADLATRFNGLATVAPDRGETGDLFAPPTDVVVPAATPKPPPTATVALAAGFGAPAGATKAERRAINARVAAIVQDGGVDLGLMRQYSGNGGCGDSLNEFYTDPAVAAAMWAVVERLAGPGGSALEPSCATGVFMHTAPAAYRVTGVEMDAISRACAAALHGDRHEIMPAQSLERFARGDGGRQFKVVVGNPPYGPRGSLTKDDKPELKSAEQYFIDTALDKAEAGGIVSLVVPAGIMNAKNGRAFRERMLRKAEFLGAQRMPNTAFEASHTDVTADIIWLRKRPDDVAGALMTVDKKVLRDLGVWDDEFLSGSYFDGRGASNLFGRVGTAMRAFGEIYTVEGSMAGVAERISGFDPHAVGTTPDVAAVVAALGADAAAVKRAMGSAMVRPYADGRAGDTKTVDGVDYVLQGKPLRWHRVDDIMKHDAVVDARPIADALERLLGGDDSVRAAVQSSIEAYVARHGIPVRVPQLVQAADHDKTLHRVIGAVDRDGRLSDAVTGRKTARVAGSVETAAATLAAENDSGTFSVSDLAERSGRAEPGLEDVLYASTVYAYAGGGQWTTMDQYLTGELWPKIDAARAALKTDGLDAGLRAKYELQVQRLEETIAPKSLEDVEIMLNSAFLPTAVIEAWIDSKTAALRASYPDSQWYRDIKPASVEFGDGVYTVTGGSGFGLLEKYLNRTGVRQDDRPTVDEWNEEFKAWLLTSALRDDIEELYNRKFRGYVGRDWSDAAIEIPGLAADRLNAYHYSSLRWALHQGKGIIADDVGLGKTVRGLMLARLAKMHGRAQKPTFVVPKSVLANWVAEVDNWFPGSRVLVIGETYSRDKAGGLKSKPDTAAERNRKYHDLTQNDYDFVFISQPAFNELDVDPALKNEYLGQDFWVQRGDKLGNAGNKKIKKVREQFNQSAGGREFEKRTDAIYFNELPIDMLIVDEAAAYKNLYAAKARFGNQPKFLGGQGQSNRAFDMGFKAKWLREKNGGKGVYGLTATPTKNSPLEVYSMLSYIAPEEFEKIGIRNSEEFLDRYCEFRGEKILSTSGAIEDGLVTSGFKNLDELREIMARYIMRRTAADVGLKLPTVSDNTHLVDMSEDQAKVYAGLRAQLAEVGTKDATGDAHIFSVMDKMAKAALDLELFDPVAFAGHSSPKYAAAAKVVAANRVDGGQVVFCESVDSHEKIAAALVAAGVPRDRIGIMNAQVASSSAARQNLSDRFNAGALDVIIGNKVMEEGVNLQKRTADIHHLDIPWDPATLQQRNGRGVRQGNKNEGIRLHAYLTRGSFDGYRYQSMRAKRDWMDVLWKGGDRVENLAREGVINREDMMVAMSADPDAEREKLVNDKAAALERYAAEGRVDASRQFVRFQSLVRNLKAIKNKDTVAARRLGVQVDRARASLAANQHFLAKAALESGDDVLVHPGSGDVVRRDTGMEITEANGSSQRWVVTGVDAVAGTVNMRLYGDTTGHKGVTVPLMKLAHGTTPFVFNAAAEAAEVGAKMEADAAAAVNTVNSYAAVMKMPPAVLEANHDVIQRRLKDGAKTYTVGLPYGSVPMTRRDTGAIELVDAYRARDIGETHDYMLPTTANREKAIQAWMAARRAARIGTKFMPAKRRGGSNEPIKAARVYDAGSSDRHVNPMSAVLNTFGGRSAEYGIDGMLVREAKTRLAAEQANRIRHAESVADIMSALMPLAAVSGSGANTVAKYPSRVLAMAWAKARQLRALGTPLLGAVPLTKYGTMENDSYAYGRAGKDKSVHAALVRMAVDSGHFDLAAAMAESGIKHSVHADHADVQQSMEKGRLRHTGDGRTRLMRAALASAEAGGYADTQRGAMSGGYYDPDRDKTHRQYLESAIANEAR